MNILFASSEATPLIKTGGLADVSGSLPLVLRQMNHDIRMVLPAYPAAVDKARPLETVATLQLPGCEEPVRILEGRLGGSRTPLYLVDAPGLLDRTGNPYTDAHGRDWPDNAERFTVFARAITAMALDHAGLGWSPEVVHCNDWQTGLVPVLLGLEWNRPATLFTIHNMSYQGLFDYTTFQRLHLPEDLWRLHGVEFHDQLSFIKGGIAFADCVNTVSPTYADEIRSHLGYGLEGLLTHLDERLQGVLNGIDYQVWNPGNDPHIPQPFDHNSFKLKVGNKRRLQERFSLPVNDKAMVFGQIGRLVEQKGVDLILDVLPELMAQPDVQLVMLGSGDPVLEQRLQEAAAAHPQQMAVHIGYDEPLSHLIEAGSDAFLMPSRFEPCGLNQIYSLRYGTVPVVHRTGGLADTVVDANAANVMNGSATGFVFEHADADGLWWAIDRAIQFYRRPGPWWEKLAVTGMRQDFSWQTSASRYLDLYQYAIDHPAPNPLR